LHPLTEISLALSDSKHAASRRIPLDQGRAGHVEALVDFRCRRTNYAFALSAVRFLDLHRSNDLIQEGLRFIARPGLMGRIEKVPHAVQVQDPDVIVQ
jgi:hypothetical protein